MKKIAIVGAGLSALVLANELKDYANVIVFEKSRGVGGRLATRYFEDYEFDHGTPFFYAKNKDFINFVHKLENKAIVKRWDAKFVEFDGNKIIQSRRWNNSFPHYVGVPKMNSIAKYLALDLEVKFNTQITKVIKQYDKWQLFDKQGNIYDDFDWLIMAIPVAQAKEILDLYSKNIKSLNDFKMSGCYSLMLGFKDPPALLFEAALVKNANISWIGINSAKPERSNNFSMVVLSTNKWAEDNIEQEKQIATEQLIKEASFILNIDLNQADHIDLHKWRYANAPRVKLSNLVDDDIKLAFCGDWTVKGVVEGAFLSAQNIYTKLKNII
jgi:predicted NAD/FAD-dependent oxidoreductase